MTKSLSYTSLINYLSAVWLLHKLFSYNTCQKSFFVTQTLKGARRVLGSPTTQAPLLSPVNIKGIFSQLDISNSFSLCFWCAVLTCFRALLRKAHVTKSHMCFSKRSFQFHKWGVMVIVDHAKTIQCRERRLFIPVYSTANSIFDLKYYLQLLFQQVGTKNDDPAFTYLCKGKKKVMTYNEFEKTLKDLTKSLGIEEVTSHSLRHSGASYLFSIGQSLINIKQRGDWKSLSVLLYLTESMSDNILRDSDVSLRLSHI